jgi:hypothetical protein
MICATWMNGSGAGVDTAQVKSSPDDLLQMLSSCRSFTTKLRLFDSYRLRQ